MIKKIILIFSILLISSVSFAQGKDMLYIFQDLAEKLSPSVVNITSEGTIETDTEAGIFDFFDFGPFGGQPKSESKKFKGTGTGFIVRDNGYIITNTHVVKDADKITVTLNDGREFPGEVLIDSRTDLALVKIKATGLKALEFGDSDKLKVGQWVVAIGNPFGFQNTITTGVISGLSREFAVGEGDNGTFYPDAIQTDASINPGNSGGPLVDLDGKVIGINSAIASPSGGSVGLGFSVPSNTAKFVIDRLIKDGKVVRGFFGLSTTKITNSLAERLGVKTGAYVKSLSKNTPAAKAGIKVEDVIVEIDGKPITDPLSLRRVVEAITPEKVVKTKLIRDKNSITINVKVGELPNNDTAPTIKSNVDLGVVVTDLTSDIKKQLKIDDDIDGVIVKSITRNGTAALAGLLPKDIITKVNGKEIKTINDYNSIIKTLNENSNVTFIVYRDDNMIAIDLK